MAVRRQHWSIARRARDSVDLLDAEAQGLHPRRPARRAVRGARSGVSPFRYVTLDGELRELRFPVIDRAQADRVLACGERVDGSSLFKGLVDVGASDLYVVPRYTTAFVDPFDPASLSLSSAASSTATARPRRSRPTCSWSGPPGRCTSARASKRGPSWSWSSSCSATRPTGRRRLSPAEHATRRRLPTVRHGHVVDEMVARLARITGAVKYAHAEAGFVAALDSETGELRRQPAASSTRSNSWLAPAAGDGRPGGGEPLGHP